MPSHKPASASWLFRDTSIIVRACEPEDAWGYFPLFLKFDQLQKQTLISLRFIANLANFEEPQPLSLSIHPHQLTHCDIAEPEDLPAGIKTQLTVDKAITSASDVLMLSLHLNSPGCVIAPISNHSLSPQESCRPSFLIFYSLCRSRNLQFYFHRSRLGDRRVHRLRELVKLLQDGKLQSVPTDFKCQAAGKGVEETNWQVFHVPEAPPQYAGTISNAPNKRPRTGSSPVPGAPASKKQDARLSSSRESSLSASYHPSQATTEADEQSHSSEPEPKVLKRPAHNTTPQPASINQGFLASDSQPSPPPYTTSTGINSKEQRLHRASAFRHIIRQELPTVLRQELPAVLRQALPGVLREIMPDVLRDVLIPALGPALATTPSRGGPHISDSGNATLPSAEPRIEALLDTKLPALVDEKLPALVEEKLPGEVDAQIAGLLDDAVDASQVALGEAVEDTLLEIKGVRDECIREVEDVARERVEDVWRVGEDVKSTGMEVLGDVEEGVARLEKRRAELQSVGERRAVSI